MCKGIKIMPGIPPLHMQAKILHDRSVVLTPLPNCIGQHSSYDRMDQVFLSILYVV